MSVLSIQSSEVTKQVVFKKNQKLREKSKKYESELKINLTN